MGYSAAASVGKRKRAHAGMHDLRDEKELRQ